MTTHTQGPWHRGGKKGLIVYGQKGYPICSCDTYHGTHPEGQDEANARRIVACVNACEGISTENLEYNLPVKELADRYNAVLKQRDMLLDVLKQIAKVETHGGDISASWTLISVKHLAQDVVEKVKGGAE